MSSPAACMTTSMAGSWTSSQKGARSPTAWGSTTASRSRVATWIRQRTGSKVSSETNSVSKPNRPTARTWPMSSRSCPGVAIRLSSGIRVTYLRMERMTGREESQSGAGAPSYKGMREQNRERELPLQGTKSGPREAGSAAVAGASRPSRNWRMTAFAAAGFSYGARWPAAGMTSSRARGMAWEISRASEGGEITSS